MGESFHNRIVAGVTLVIDGIESDNYVAGVSGWRIARDGSAEFTSLAVDGGSAVQITITFTDGSQIRLFGGNYTEDSGAVIGGTWATLTPKPQPGATWAPGAIGAQSDATPAAFVLLASPYNTMIPGTQSRLKMTSGGIVDLDASIVQVTAGAGNGGGPFFVLASDTGRKILASRTVGEAQNRVEIRGDGSTSIGDGTNPPDSFFFRDSGATFGIQRLLRIYAVASGNNALEIRNDGQAQPTIQVKSSASIGFGGGVNPPDAALYRVGANKLAAADIVADLAGTPETWHGVAALGYAANWADFGGAAQAGRYRRMPDGTVSLSGAVKTTAAINQPSTIFTLPVGYRPAASEIFPAGVVLVGSTITVQPDGQVVLSNVGNGVNVPILGLSHVRFPLASLT